LAKANQWIAGEENTFIFQRQQIFLYPESQLVIRKVLTGELEKFTKLLQGSALTETENAEQFEITVLHPHGPSIAGESAAAAGNTLCQIESQASYRRRYRLSAWAPQVVTMVTPVVNVPSAWRNCMGSKSDMFICWYLTTAGSANGYCL
jgi:hypothetical protein